MTKNCKNCAKKYLCKNYEKVCEKYEKEPYTVLKRVEGDIKIIERVDE